MNVKPTMSLKLFEKSDKKLLMNSDELTYLEQLPTEVEIYRGTYSKNNFKALSWTDNYDTAKYAHGLCPLTCSKIQLFVKFDYHYSLECTEYVFHF